MSHQYRWIDSDGPDPSLRPHARREHRRRPSGVAGRVDADAAAGDPLRDVHLLRLWTAEGSAAEAPVLKYL